MSIELELEELRTHLDLHTLTPQLSTCICSCQRWERPRGEGVKRLHHQHVVDTLLEWRVSTDAALPMHVGEADD